MSTPNKYKPATNRPIHVYIAVLCGAERSHWIHPMLHSLLMKWAFTERRVHFSHTLAYSIFPVSAARNRIVEDMFLKSDADILLMLDNDVVPQANFIESILEMPAECDIFCPPYFVWNPTRQITSLCFGEWDGKQMVQPEQMRAGDWVEGGAGGTGCMAVRRRVFTDGKLAKPFFKIIMDDYEFQAMSEDIYFTKNAKEAGYRVFSNALYVCSHYHTIDLAEVNAGSVKLIGSYIDTVRAKYADIGIDINTISRELHPELFS